MTANLVPIRKVEAATLLVLAILLGTNEPATVGLAVDLPILIVALALWPRGRRQFPSAGETRRPGSPSTPEIRRLEFIEGLRREAIPLRARYADAATLPGEPRNQKAIAEARSAIESWILTARAGFAPYPEFAGIFEAHSGEGLLGELDGRIWRLAQLKSLAEVSTRIAITV